MCTLVCFGGEGMSEKWSHLNSYSDSLALLNWTRKICQCSSAAKMTKEHESSLLFCLYSTRWMDGVKNPLKLVDYRASHVNVATKKL